MSMFRVVTLWPSIKYNVQFMRHGVHSSEKKLHLLEMTVKGYCYIKLRFLFLETYLLCYHLMILFVIPSSSLYVL
jgi:hypothetical protein